jgi:hypothetical protein
MSNEDLIAKIISNGSGHEVSMFGDFSIYQLEDGRYAVNSCQRIKDKEDEEEHLFEDPMEAAEYFEKRRKELELGFEFEKEDA